MIEHALASPAWDPSVNRTYDLDGMVFQLLGFDSRMNKLGQNPAFGPAVAGNGGRIRKGRTTMVRHAQGRDRISEFRHSTGRSWSPSSRNPVAGGSRARHSIPTTGNTALKRISSRSCTRAGSASITEFQAILPCKVRFFLCWPASSRAEDMRPSRFATALSIRCWVGMHKMYRQPSQFVTSVHRSLDAHIYPRAAR